MATKKQNGTVLFRSEGNKVLGGVCGGLGEVFNIDPTIVRALFVLGTLFGGSGVLLYIILWVLIPSESKTSKSSNDNIRENIDEMKERAHSFSKDFHTNNNSSHMLVAIVLIALGVMFLLNNFGFVNAFSFNRLWPVFLVIFGLLILTKNNRK